MRRIMIVGGPGSGKSTLARAIGSALEVRVIHFDQIHWLPGWVSRTEAEKIELVKEAIADDAWVFEGNHAPTFGLRTARADTLIFLDTPRRLRMIRIIRRIMRDHGKTRPDMTDNCPEKFDWEFLRWAWDWTRTSRAKTIALVESCQGHLDIITLRSSRDVTHFLQKLTADAP